MKNKLKNTALCIMNYALCIAMLLGATLLTGCQKDDSGLSNLADGTATFNVAVDNGVQTRSSDPTSPNPLPSRYIMEVYEVATPTTAISGTAQQRYEATTGSFSVVLKDGVNYACLFWADYGTKDGTDNEYNASDLKAVKIAKQATKEAFGGFVRFTYDSKASSTDKAKYLNVSLTHAVAQVNYKQIEAFTGTAADSLMVEFTKTFAVNLDGGAVTEIKDGAASVPVTHKIKGFGKSVANYPMNLGTSYIIADSSAQTVMDIKATFNNEVVRDITNVPFQRNYKTNIKGAYSNLYATTLSFTCDDAWETPDNNVVFPYFDPFAYIRRPVTTLQTDIIKAGFDAADPFSLIDMDFKSYTKGDRKVCYLSLDDNNIWVAADIDTKEGVTKDKLVSFLTEKYAQIKDIPYLDVAMVVISSQEGDLPNFDSLIAKIESLNETEIADLVCFYAYRVELNGVIYHYGAGYSSGTVDGYTSVKGLVEFRFQNESNM